MTPDLLVLVLPIFELGPRASEDDPLAGDAPRADLAGVEVLDDVRRDPRGEHEDADGRVRAVADLVPALLAAPERDDFALAQLLLALMRAQPRRGAAAIVFVGRSGLSTCGKIENSTSPSASSPPSGGVQMTKSSPILGVITMLPALNPTQTVSSDGKRSANPDSRIQWHRYNESPPFTSRASVSLTRGTQSSSSMLGSAVSSSTPRDFQPNSIIGQRGSCPVMKFHALGGPAMGCPYDAVGMQRALDSAIGLPSRSTSASWMLVFLMPADVRRNFMPPSWSRCCRRERS